MQFAWDQAAPGITAAFQQLMANPYGQGQKAQVDAETALARAMWGIEQNKAGIEAAQARAAKDNADTAVVTGRPALVDELALLAARQRGFTGGQDSFNEGRARMKQGLPARVYDSGEQSMIDPKAETEITRALVEHLPLLGVENWNPQQIAQARGEYGEQNRLADVQSGAVPVEQYQAEQFARKGQPRYGVQGNEMIDQLGAIPFQGQTALGKSMIRENDAQGARASAAAGGADKFKLEAMDDGNGGTVLVRVPIKGPEGVVPLPDGVKPRPKRDPEVQGNAEYKAAYPYGATSSDPSQPEFLAMKKAGKDPVVEFPKIMADARKALKAGKDPAAVRARLQQYGINPARLDQ